VTHLMYDGLFEEEIGNPKELLYGWLKRSSICYELDPNYSKSHRENVKLTEENGYK
jgi:hypothetical protein